jgi:hypothetical protein
MHKKYYEFQYNMLEYNYNHLYIQQKKQEHTIFKMYSKMENMNIHKP